MTFKTLIKTGLLTGALMSPLMFAGNADAAGYCREYQKSIRVGGHIESGYGTACMQPDGSWMITDTQGSVDPFDELREQNVTLVAYQQPVYYQYGPRFRPVTYYAPVRRYYRSTPGISFYFGNGNRWDNGRHNGWNRNDRDWGRNRDWDHDDDHSLFGHILAIGQHHTAYVTDSKAINHH